MTGSTAAVVAAALSAFAAFVALVAVVLLGRRTRDLGRVLRALREEMLPLASEVRAVADQAATEMERVGDVLGSAEAVSATVDSASRLAYRAFANPVVKAVAYISGLGGALRRLFGRDPAARRRARGTTAGAPILGAAVAKAGTGAQGPGRKERRRQRRHEAQAHGQAVPR